MVALMAGVLAIPLTWVGLNLVDLGIPPEDPIPYYIDWSMDRPTLLYTGAVSILTGIIFGLMPALQASRGKLHLALKEGGRGTGTGARKNRLRSALVVVEVALALPREVFLAVELRLELVVAREAEADQAVEPRVPIDAQRAAVARFLDQIAERGRQDIAALFAEQRKGLTAKSRKVPRLRHLAPPLSPKGCSSRTRLPRRRNRANDSGSPRRIGARHETTCPMEGICNPRDGGKKGKIRGLQGIEW